MSKKRAEPGRRSPPSQAGRSARCASTARLKFDSLHRSARTGCRGPQRLVRMSPHTGEGVPYVVDSTRVADRGRRRRSRSVGRLRALALGIAIGLAWPSLRARDWAGTVPADLGVIFPQGLRIDLPDGTGWALPPGWPRDTRRPDRRRTGESSRAAGKRGAKVTTLPRWRCFFRHFRGYGRPSRNGRSRRSSVQSERSERARGSGSGPACSMQA